MGQQKVTAVLVVYEKNYSDSKSWDTLLSWLDASKNKHCEGFVLDSLIIYDNSRLPANSSAMAPKEQIKYFHNSKNGGTAAAYTYAVRFLEDTVNEWILLLDQDTTLPQDYLLKSSSVLHLVLQENVSSILPKVKHGKKMVSPALISKLGSIKPFLDDRRLGNKDVVTAISSGSFINLNLFKKILPFPNGLWLDYVDHWMHLQFNKLGYYPIFVDCLIDHDLSVEDRGNLTPSRLDNIFMGEMIFCKYLNLAATLILPIRLVVRAFKYLWIKPSLALRIIISLVKK